MLDDWHINNYVVMTMSKQLDLDVWESVHPCHIDMPEIIPVVRKVKYIWYLICPSDSHIHLKIIQENTNLLINELTLVTIYLYTELLESSTNIIYWYVQLQQMIELPINTINRHIAIHTHTNWHIPNPKCLGISAICSVLNGVILTL